MFKRLSLKNISIQKRLSVFIFILILGVVLIFGYTSYLAVKNTALTSAKNRLSTLTQQIGNLFQQSTIKLLSNAAEIAKRNAVVDFLKTNGKDSAIIAKQLLNNARADTALPLVELYNAVGIKVLSSDKDRSTVKIIKERAPVFPSATSDEVGKLYTNKGRIYFPIIASVKDGDKLIGYVVQWRLLISSEKEIDAFSNLIGENGRLYFGNDDGSFWTDGLTYVPAPPIDIKHPESVISYKGPFGYSIIGSATQIPQTHWLILITLSQTIITKATNSFLYSTVFIGTVLLLLGLVVAWLLGRYITKPLKRLTIATNEITQGNYNLHIDLNRKDELGTLAEAFNTMVKKVLQSQQTLEKKVEERTAELQLLNEELESFSYSVSHDLQAPLRIINNYVGLLKSEKAAGFDEETQRMLKSIEKQALRMNQLIQDIFNLSRIDKGELSIEKADMNAIVRSVIEEQFAAKFNSTEIKISSLDSACCDSSLIRQVWINLLGNAFKFSRNEDAPSIVIESYKNADEIVYSIKDNGAGFDKTYADKLFGAFQRLHSKSEFEGTGVGLALVKRIIEKHKGRVWAESELQKGATFYFTLPVE